MTMLNRVAISTVCEIQTWWGMKYKGTVINKRRKKVENKRPMHLEVQTDKGYNMLISEDDIVKYEALGYDRDYIVSLCGEYCNKCGSDNFKVKFEERNLKIEKVACDDCDEILFSSES
ncbi:hypothetical protein MHZ36_13945 [Staphylococcus sp. ACRSN]|uniref:hypothetical protein n=1 Tax=Staphylococcus sp. ACRSN TaxID=2918214 RepID=UPI001EF387B3|nr:hypothetical protein [Staphylococcus sp. ACRSN]MCG7340361.1 hypothetical protein [Staphylococcus sp. ACRSN]